MIKGGISVKTIIVLVILVLVGVLGFFGVNTVRTYMSGAASTYEPKGVLAKVSGDKKNVEITWTTEKESTGIVEYGTTPASLLLRVAESGMNVSHKVTLSTSSLKPGVSYYFRIRIGEEVFDNSGIPYSFKNESGTLPTPTLSEAAGVTLVPTAVSGSRCNRDTDYNGDGVVNSIDYISCAQKSGKVTAVPNPTKGAAGGGCKAGVDYDGNGVINSIDYIGCLQNKK